MLTTFSKHYRHKYGAVVGKVPLDAGLVCPNRARGGCIYCRPASFTPHYLNNEESLARQLVKGSETLRRRNIRIFFGYFQQETITALPLRELAPLLLQVATHPAVVGLILSTRPDCLDEEQLAFLDELAQRSGKEILIELGLQSSHERSLAYLQRHHDFATYVATAQKIRRRRGLQLGTHLILGIPGESREDMVRTVQRVCALGVDALKLHHLQVIRDTPLQQIHDREALPLFTAPAYLELLAELVAHIPARVVLHRLWSTSHPALLLAPRWDLQPQELSTALFEIMTRQQRYQGKYVAGE